MRSANRSNTILGDPYKLFKQFVVSCNYRWVNLLIFFCTFASAKNLENDAFLRERMNQQGWVPLTHIAGFKKVRLHAQLDQ